MDVVARRFEVYDITLDPTVGSEMRKRRPCLVISPNEMNQYIRTVIVAPMTTTTRAYPSRVACTFQGKKGQVALDQIRTVDRARLTKRLGTLGKAPASAVLAMLHEIFAE